MIYIWEEMAQVYSCSSWGDFTLAKLRGLWKTSYREEYLCLEQISRRVLGEAHVYPKWGIVRWVRVLDGTLGRRLSCLANLIHNT